jgi:hypothetical protein
MNPGCMLTLSEGEREGERGERERGEREREERGREG